MFFSKKKEEEPVDPKEQLKRHAVYALHALKKKKYDKELFQEFFSTLRQFFSGYFHFRDSTTFEEMEEQIVHKHLEKHMHDKVKVLLETVSRIKYGGLDLTKDEFEELIDESVHVIKEL